jgi:xylulokinase
MLHNSKTLAIDFGTSRCKVGVIDTKGKVHSITAKEFGTQTLGNGAIETAEKVWRTTIFKCIREALGKAGARQVAMVSVTAQTACPVCFDRNDRPVGPIISHLDTRAKIQLEKASKIFPESYVASKLVGNLRWLKEMKPQSFRRIKQVCDVKEYVGKLLTGKLTRDAMQLPRSRISKMADALGIDGEIFGKEHDFATPIGGCRPEVRDLCGLQPGTPVLVCPFDGLTGVIGSGLAQPNVLAEVAGTTDFMATTSRAGQSRSHSYPSVGWDSIDRANPHDRLRIVYTSPPLGFFYDWFRGILYGKDRGNQQALIEREISEESNSDDMLFVPKFSFETHGWKGNGQLLDIELGKKRSEILRAVMKGIAMNARCIISDLTSDGATVQSVRLSGGGSRSEAWNQMRADIYGVPVSLLQTSETGCLGGAVFAASALGVYGGLREASESMVHVVKEYAPNPTRVKEYERTFQRFESIYLHMD